MKTLEEIGVNLYMPGNILGIFLSLLSQKIIIATPLSNETQKTWEVKEHSETCRQPGSSAFIHNHDYALQFSSLLSLKQNIFLNPPSSQLYQHPQSECIKNTLKL